MNKALWRCFKRKDIEMRKVVVDAGIRPSASPVKKHGKVVGDCGGAGRS
jgi:hypothetical protein